MVKEIRARFTKGVIEPLEELDLQEGEEILISVQEISSNDEARDAFARAAGGWKGLVDTDALLRDFKTSRKIRAPEIEL